ncbi:aminotransferase class IV family protein [Streptomyces sp. SP17BM10]|uniref:aminotransferase class IV family protein n=1 Tax=Streptomyces sp. SP17BM10 TaxID=3002530 RepID=UPI002E79B32D|nr:aminotransferase class IV family protein [Streptomyces sp. SP17BM10]MEE1787683.1 aminotransferase class IV family protein [Streptomyces sp. SP17BM10]
MAEIEIDGAPADAARVAALGLLNYGHFTTLRVGAGRVRGLALHLERLVRDCRALFGAELDPDVVRGRIRAVLPPDGAEAIVRVTVYDPELGLERPSGPAAPSLLVTTRPAPAAVPGPLRVRTVAYVREAPQVKHVGLFGLIRHRREAQLAGFDDALLVDPAGRVTEGATWNVGFVDDGGRVVWPQGPSLPGVTAALLARAYGGPQESGPVDAVELDRFKAAFAVNAGVGVRPVAAVDGTRFDADHPVLGELRTAYEGVTADPV